MHRVICFTLWKKKFQLNLNLDRGKTPKVQIVNFLADGERGYVSLHVSMF